MKICCSVFQVVANLVVCFSFFVSVISIANIDPASSFFFQHSFYFIKDIAEFINILLKGWLKTKLSIASIITQSPVRRACNATVNKLIRKGFKDCQTVAMMDGVVISSTPFALNVALPHLRD